MIPTRRTRAKSQYDVIVIGGGHAGCEAAHASARMGCRTALVTLNAQRIGLMSCNPAMGGLAKGQLMREIDALGGIMARNTDETAIQYRVLNSSKGPAVRASRAQCDKLLYAKKMQEFLGKIGNLEIVEAEVDEILVEENGNSRRVRGVRIQGEDVLARAVVITSGTFMGAIMHTGAVQSAGGRVGDPASMGLSSCLARLGIQLKRLKTGTPPRLHKDSIDYSRTESQPGDEYPRPISFFYPHDRFPVLPQVNCFITYTNKQTHEIIHENINSSPMFSGAITGIGPRYCPSIEDKIFRFADKDRHQIFLEPEGLDVPEIYVNGISTSLPASVQEAFVRSVPGLEKAVFLRHGYAVEYDAIHSTQLSPSLELIDIKGLLFAGQVNGTSGYEEAGAQGIVAGVNAVRHLKEQEPWILRRDEAYIGVLCDDLSLTGLDEPYRMFTSRAEYRLLLRDDNADLRLSEEGYRLGVLSSEDFARFCRKKARMSEWKATLEQKFLNPNVDRAEWFEKRGYRQPQDRVSFYSLLKRPEVHWADLIELDSAILGPPRLQKDNAGRFEWEQLWENAIFEQIEIQTKYEGYIQRDLEILEGVRRNEATPIPAEMDYKGVHGLSNEVVARLQKTRPRTIGQASRMQGMTPAALANLFLHLKTRDRPLNG